MMEDVHPRRHRGERSLAWLRAARGRQDRHFARRLVRRLHLQADLRRVGWLRRQSRTGAGGRKVGAAHLDRVHEARAPASRVPQRRRLRLRRTASSASISIRKAASWPPGSVPTFAAEVFIAGTQPNEFCQLHGGGTTHVAGWETTPSTAAVQLRRLSHLASRPGDRPPRSSDTVVMLPPGDAPPHETPIAKEEKEKKKGFFGRLKDIFK